jgi:signal peptidase II
MRAQPTAEDHPISASAISPSMAWARAGLVLVVVVALDQLSKHLVEGSIVPGEERRVLPGLQFVDEHNHGVAFGFLPGHHVAVTVVIGVAVLALLAYFLRNSTRPLIWLPTGMLVGGAIGNIADRLRAGSVTDFVKLPLGWPPFNLADAAITLGVLLLIIVIERPRGQDAP